MSEPAPGFAAEGKSSIDRPKEAGGKEPPVEARPELTFPDLPRLELDQLLGQLIERATEVMGSQGRLRGLLRANQTIVADLALPVVLRHVAEAARELLGARYAALGVLAPSAGLAEFIHVGMAEDAVASIAHLPEGKGLLGALIEEPAPIRLDVLGADQRSSGFPAGHPPMTSFLGVPIRIRDEVYGNLYLTESLNGGFSQEDEKLAGALAATAAVAIDNARHYESTRRRGEWLTATAAVSRQMLAPQSGDPLRSIAEHAQSLTDADLVAILLPETAARDLLRVEVAIGGPSTEAAASRLRGRVSPVDGSLCAHAFTQGQPIRLRDPGDRPELPASIVAEEVEAGPMLVVPLTGSTQTNGVLAVVRRPGRAAFSAEDLDMAAGFANQASLGLELAQARAEQERAGMLEERQRIAEDLHDHVIQRLFAAGLTLHGLASRVDSDTLARQLIDVVQSLDDTISQIRTSIFALQHAGEPTGGGLRAEVLDVVAAAAESLGFTPDLRFSGPIDTLLKTSPARSQHHQGREGTVAEDFLAVLREALSNVARHAQASRVEIDVLAGSGTDGAAAELVLEVRDNGTGLGSATRRSGLANLRARAERHHGSLDLTPASPTGTCLRWAVPLR